MSKTLYSTEIIYVNLHSSYMYAGLGTGLLWLLIMQGFCKVFDFSDRFFCATSIPTLPNPSITQSTISSNLI